MQAIDRNDLGQAPDLADNAGRVARVKVIDAAIEASTQQRRVVEVLAVLDQAQVPSGRIYTAADIAHDPHYQARDMLLPTLQADGSTVLLPGIVPKLSRTPGRTRQPAPMAVGQDSAAILQEMGLSPEQIHSLKAQGIVA